MEAMQKALVEWHKKFGVAINSSPTIPEQKVIELRIELILEEFKEFEQASKEKDLVEVADALADLLYVILGAGVSYGIDLEPIFNEVHRSNMSKVWEDGTVHYREDGKVIKPPTYSPAEIAKELTKQL